MINEQFGKHYVEVVSLENRYRYGTVLTITKINKKQKYNGWLPNLFTKFAIPIVFSSLNTVGMYFFHNVISQMTGTTIKTGTPFLTLRQMSTEGGIFKLDFLP